MSFQLPSDPELERQLLAICLVDADAFLEARDSVTGSEFFAPGNQAVWAALCSVHADAGTVDGVLVEAAVEVRGDAEFGRKALEAARSTLPRVGRVAAVADGVRDLAIARELIMWAMRHPRTLADSEGGVRAWLDASEAAFGQILAGRASVARGVDMKDAAAEAWRALEARSKSDTPKGRPMGLAALERLLGGLRDGSLVVLAGRPGMGKSALAMHIACTVAQSDPVLVVSQEMPTGELVDRIAAARARVPVEAIAQASIGADTWDQVAGGYAMAAELDMRIEDRPGLTMEDVRRAARRMKRERGGRLGLVVIDYLQLMRARDQRIPREQQVAEMTRGAKELAKELGLPVLLLSQLNRSLESRPNKRPQLSDLRESGAIEQDCDVAMFVYRDEVYDPHSQDKGVAEIIVGKNRSGRCGRARVAFLAERTAFADLQEDSNVVPIRAPSHNDNERRYWDD